MFWWMGPWELGIFVIPLLCLFAYLVPTVVAAVRKTRHLPGIVVLNIFTGWTFFGWVGSLVWAAVDEKKTQPES